MIWIVLKWATIKNSFFLLLNLLKLNSLKIKYFSIVQYREVFSFKNDDY